MLSFQTSPADSSGGCTAAGEAAARMPRPGMIRPVPNKLSIVSAHATAFPDRSIATRLVEAGNRGGSARRQALRREDFGRRNAPGAIACQDRQVTGHGPSDVVRVVCQVIERGRRG